MWKFLLPFAAFLADLPRLLFAEPSPAPLLRSASSQPMGTRQASVTGAERVEGAGASEAAGGAS